MEQQELIISLNQRMDDGQVADGTDGAIVIKQEHVDGEMQIEQQDIGENVEEDIAEGVPLSIDDFVEFHNQQVKVLKDEIGYVTKCFDVMYKYKNVCDLIVEDYFKTDENFHYKDILQTLESDLYAIIAEDENQYQALLNEINTEITLNDSNQFEFVESDILTEDEECQLQSQGKLF